MFVLDSNILGAMYAGNTKILQQLEQIDVAEITTTIVNKVELLRGRMDYLLKADCGEDILRAQVLFKETERVLTEIPILDFDQSAAEHFERLNQITSVRKMGRADLLIATIALANRGTLVTRNLKDFQRVPELKLVNWLD